MRKYILLTFFSIGLILVSCSKTEENSIKEEQKELSSSPLVGSWMYFGYVDETNGSELRDNDECEDENTFIFNGDATYQYNSYQLNSDSGKCITVVNQTGTWELISDNKMKLNYNRDPEPYIYELEFVITQDVLGITVEESGTVFSEKYRLQ